MSDLKAKFEELLEKFCASNSVRMTHPVDHKSYKTAKASFLASIEDLEKPKCTWTLDSHGVYDANCGESWIYYFDTANEDGVKFCIYCGGEIVIDEKVNHNA